MAGFGKCLWVGVAVLVTGCAVKSEEKAAPPGTHACSPLDPVEAPISLSDVLVVARAADGTLYVVDTEDYEHRVFVSSGTELVRKAVSGEGEINDGTATTYLVTFERDDATYTIGVQTSGAAPIVAVAPGSSRSFDEVQGSGEMLTPVSESELEGLTLRNLPGGMNVEFLGRTDSGEVVAVLSPIDFYCYDEFRVFFGQPEQVLERPLVNLLRARSGWTTAVFDLDGTTAGVSYDYPEPPTLTVRDMTRTLEAQAAGDFETFSYQCLDAPNPPVLCPPRDGGT
jgi:hypothetical protein